MKNWKIGADNNSCIKVVDASFLQGVTTIPKDFYEFFGITEKSSESINAKFRFAGISYSVKISKKKFGNTWQFRIPNELNLALFGQNSEPGVKVVVFKKIFGEGIVFELSIDNNPDYLSK